MVAFDLLERALQVSRYTRTRTEYFKPVELYTKAKMESFESVEFCWKDILK